ncbi:MAG: HAD family hydrolase [Candidatus Dojkabacteria bacterium]
MKAVVFDFDGTIADTLQAGIEAYNIIAPKYGLKQVQKSEIKKLRNKSMAELVKESGICIWRIPLLARSVKKEFRKLVQECRLFPGINKLIQKLSAKFEIYILSSNSQSNIELFFKQYPEVRAKIKKIYSEKSIFGKDKALKKIMKREKLGHNDFVYVGDEVRDYIACQKASVNCISVSWGYNSREILEKYNDLIFDNADNLLAFLQNNGNMTV